MEKDVSIALKALTHAGKEFSCLGLSDCSANCDTIYGEVEELQQLIPLVQVEAVHSACYCCPAAFPSSVGQCTRASQRDLHSFLSDLLCSILDSPPTLNTNFAPGRLVLQPPGFFNPQCRLQNIAICSHSSSPASRSTSEPESHIAGC
jgi:starvation-inducible outer membrane lipoprotein